MRPSWIVLSACIACGGSATSAIESGAPPEKAVEGAYVGSLRSIGFVYDLLGDGHVVHHDVTTTQRYDLVATGPNTVMLRGTLSGVECAVPLALNNDGTLTFASSAACSASSPYAGYVYGGSGRWDRSGSLSFSVVTGQGLPAGAYYDETLSEAHKL